MFIKNQLQLLIPRRSVACLHHKEHFQPADDYISYLYLEDEEWVREDYCVQCWQQVEKQKSEKGNYWKGKIPVRKKEKSTPDERAIKLLREWALDAHLENKKNLFFLTLYLERLKQIQRRSELKDKKLPLIDYYEVLETGEIFPIESCILSGQDTEKMQQDLLSKLLPQD